MRTHRVDWYHHLPPHVKEILATLEGAGFDACLVGGCVRDLWLDIPPKDFDLVSSATPDEVEKLFTRTEGVGRQFGIMIVVTPEGPVEVARYRADSEYKDGRHPEGVVFSSPEEDAKRRDFTINGLFYRPADKQIIDYVGGLEDLEAKLIRCVGDPELRFEEDSLRMLRAARFHSQLAMKGFKLDPALASAVRRRAGRLSLVSRERVTQELDKIFLSPQPSVGLFDLVLLGLWENVFQAPPPNAAVHANFDVLAETFLLLASRPATSALYFAAAHRWLPGFREDAFVLTKDCKAAISRVPSLLERLRKYTSLFRHEKKRLLVDSLIFEAMAILELEGGEEAQAELDSAEENRKNWAESRLLDPPLLLSGEDLKSLGLKPGPDFKRLMDCVRTAQLNEELNTKGEALELVKKLLSPGKNS